MEGNWCGVSNTGVTDGTMTAQLLLLVSFALFVSCVSSTANVTATEPQPVDESDQRLEVYDGVYVNLPKNDTERAMTVELDLNKTFGSEEGRSKKKNMLQRILPMFIMPFVIQSAIIPLALGMLKFMMVKSFLVGKLALALIMFNAFRNHNSFKGRDAEMASVHYGYHGHGMEEYGSYFNH